MCYCFTFIIIDKRFVKITNIEAETLKSVLLVICPLVSELDVHTHTVFTYLVMSRFYTSIDIMNPVNYN